MNWKAVTCPQCSAPLPRVALWRSVKCGSCGALITKEGEPLVQRDDFRQALARTASLNNGGRLITCGGASYQLLEALGSGEISEVYLARRTGSQPLLATLKLSSAPTAATRYASEADALNQLQDQAGEGPAAYAAQRLPVVLGCGAVADSTATQALILRHPVGFWGSLAALNHRFPQGLDPRHAIWIWRRLLDALHFIHAQGWHHGNVCPEHALVHPQDHGVRLIGWHLAKKEHSRQAQAVDLMRSARIIQVLISGGSDTHAAADKLAPELADMLAQAAHDADFCQRQGARGLDTLLVIQAEKAFGPPKFLPLHV